jgi:hypothetical protein
VTSTHGEGSAFTIRLPVVLVDGDGEASDQEAAELARGRFVGLGEALEQPADLLPREADPGIDHRAVSGWAATSR